MEIRHKIKFILAGVVAVGILTAGVFLLYFAQSLTDEQLLSEVADSPFLLEYKNDDSDEELVLIPQFTKIADFNHDGLADVLGVAIPRSQLDGEWFGAMYVTGLLQQSGKQVEYLKPLLFQWDDARMFFPIKVSYAEIVRNTLRLHLQVLNPVRQNTSPYMYFEVCGKYIQYADLEIECPTNDPV